jgi:diaminohydroxyphosphoribosylaminopyrimidine deaminase/5-amino-6-(5-phosphoribosylamino)uracil reductase
LFKYTVLSILEEHELYISRCIQLGLQGIFSALPNPSVGAVIVYNGIIIGEGYTSDYGGAHAEVNAINSVKNQELLKKSTLYVSLEPCSHFGKTPPCCDLIIEKKIPKVVIGTTDPFAKVCGTGIQKMRNSGIEVITGVLENECQTSNKRFFTFHQKKRPYIILKWAETADNFIAPLQKESSSPYWISNIYAQQNVHQWRSEEMAFLVGTNTVLQDNPSLTTRNWFGKNPVRVYLDRNGKIDNSFAIKDTSSQTICITNRTDLQNTNNVTYAFANFDQNLPEQICNILYQNHLLSVVIEGGTKTLQSFINANLWDETRIFISNSILKTGVKAPVFSSFSKSETKIIYNNTLKTVYP